jgi:hypothetical protein
MLGSKLFLRHSISKGTQKKIYTRFSFKFEYSRRFGIFTRHFAKQTRKEKKVFFYLVLFLRITVQWKSVRQIIERKKWFKQ